MQRKRSWLLQEVKIFGGIDKLDTFVIKREINEDRRYNMA